MEGRNKVWKGEEVRSRWEERGRSGWEEEQGPGGRTE